MENLKNILDVTVNGMNALDCVKSVKNRLETIENKAFNVAVLSAYATGTTIPAYNGKGEATVDKKMTQASFLKLVNRSKATLSRWIKGVNFIINDGKFSDFAMGIIPFQFDKVIHYYENKEIFDKEEITLLFAITEMSLSDLEAIAPKKTKEKKEEETKTSENSDTEEEKTPQKNKSEEAKELSVLLDEKEWTIPSDIFFKYAKPVLVEK